MMKIYHYLLLLLFLFSIPEKTINNPISDLYSDDYRISCTQIALADHSPLGQVEKQEEAQVFSFKPLGEGFPIALFSLSAPISNDFFNLELEENGTSNRTFELFLLYRQLLI